jgi:predicted acetyltransferase
MTTAHMDSDSRVTGVRLTEARPRDAQILQNLLQLYTHDFTEWWSGTSRGDLNSAGRYEDYPLSPYWVRPNWSAWFIWHNDVLAGFSLINDQTHSGQPADRNVAEFFILRKHRRQGVGQIAAEHIFSSHPGSWEVAVARKNVQAGKFWGKTIRNAGPASQIRELDLHGPAWDGPVFRFEWLVP